MLFVARMDSLGFTVSSTVLQAAVWVTPSLLVAHDGVPCTFPNKDLEESIVQSRVRGRGRGPWRCRARVSVGCNDQISPTQLQGVSHAAYNFLSLRHSKALKDAKAGIRRDANACNDMLKVQDFHNPARSFVRKCKGSLVADGPQSQWRGSIFTA